MAQNIPVPALAADKLNIALGGFSYNIHFRFSTRESKGRWYFDLYEEDGTEVKLGVKVMENQSLLARYLLDNFSGDILCIEMEKRGEKYVGRDNLGIGKKYSLVYFTQEEIDNGG